MPRISQEKKNRISEQILQYLFSSSPQAKFTVEIAREIARDEEFTKFILSELKSKNLIIEIKKNAAGSDYIRRQRWRLSDEVYSVYSSQLKL